MKILGRAAMVLAIVAALTACSPQNEPMYPGDSLLLGAPGAVIDTIEGVAYYPACSNELLEFDGVTYYPFSPANQDDFPYVGEHLAPTDEAQALADAGAGPRGMSRGMLPAVVAPGPGDDTGTLTRFEGGFAYWISDNGLLSTWLTTQELTYSWVC
jgi:hypothetical protein